MAEFAQLRPTAVVPLGATAALMIGGGRFGTSGQQPSRAEPVPGEQGVMECA